MKYRVEFIICHNDGTWFMSEMEVPEKTVILGADDMVYYGLDHGLEQVENVCHIGVMNFHDIEEEDDSGTLTSYDIGENNE